jgi:hypothetical protein
VDPIDALLSRWAKETFRPDSKDERRKAYGECLEEGLRAVQWSKRIYAATHVWFLADAWKREFRKGGTSVRAQVHLQCAEEISKIIEGGSE